MKFRSPTYASFTQAGTHIALNMHIHRNGAKTTPAFQHALCVTTLKSQRNITYIIVIERGNVEIDRGNVEIDRGNVEIDRGNVKIYRGIVKMFSHWSHCRPTTPGWHWHWPSDGGVEKAYDDREKEHEDREGI